jgi:hypothetical protein
VPVKVNGSQRAVAARSHGTLASDFNDDYVPGVRGDGGRGSRGECDLRIRVIRHPERSPHTISISGLMIIVSSNPYSYLLG